MPITRKEERSVERAMNQACNAVVDAHEAADQGTFNSDHIANVEKAQVELCLLMGRYADLLGLLPEHMQECIRFHEGLADKLLRNHYSMLHGRYEDYWRRPPGTGPGTHGIMRKVIIDDVVYERAIACNNPAAGRVKLDAWERQVRERHGTVKQAA
jgi:hypothetical protein